MHKKEWEANTPQAQNRRYGLWCNSIGCDLCTKCVKLLIYQKTKEAIENEESTYSNIKFNKRDNRPLDDVIWYTIPSWFP